MNDKFDELTKNMAQSVTRRSALKTLGHSLGGLALTRFGLNEAQAITNGQLDGNGHPNVGGFVWLKNIWSPDPPPVFIGTDSRRARTPNSPLWAMGRCWGTTTGTGLFRPMASAESRSPGTGSCMIDGCS
jgi:hypothetical protein